MGAVITASNTHSQDKLADRLNEVHGTGGVIAVQIVLS
ncbi:hypothetical protein M2418_001768 [Rhizobium sp. BIGb0125]|nr:hypothetical protein [Rhizobium sp. BIGb0125]